MTRERVGQHVLTCAYASSLAAVGSAGEFFSHSVFSGHSQFRGKHGVVSTPNPFSHNGGIDGSAQLTADSRPPVYLFNCLRRFINDLYTRRPCIRGLAISGRASSSSSVRSLIGLTMIIAAAHLTRSRGHKAVNLSLRTDTDSSTGQLMSHVFRPPAWWEFNENNERKSWLF